MTEMMLNPNMVDAAKSLLTKNEIISLSEITGIAESSIREMIAGRRKCSCELIDKIQNACKIRHRYIGDIIQTEFQCSNQ